MQTPSWDEYFINLSRLVATKSKDRSTKVGCVIVGPDKEIVSTGFNGFPRGIDDNVEARHERPTKYFFTEHDVRNAIYNAARSGIKTMGCTIYSESPPCADCSRAIIQAGIVSVIISEKNPFNNNHFWEHSLNVGREMLLEAGITVKILKI